MIIFHVVSRRHQSFWLYIYIAPKEWISSANVQLLALSSLSLSLLSSLSLSLSLYLYIYIYIYIYIYCGVLASPPRFSSLVLIRDH